MNLDRVISAMLRSCSLVAAGAAGLMASSVAAQTAMDTAGGSLPEQDFTDPQAPVPAETNIEGSIGAASTTDQLGDRAKKARSLVPEGRDVSVVISPYLWLPVVKGNVGGTEPGALVFKIDTGDLLNAFKFGGLIHGELHHKSGWGLSLDYMFANLSTGGDIGIGDLNTKVDANILEATVLRRVALGEDALDLYGGIRRWDSKVVVNVKIQTLNFDILTGDTWTDPILGARYQHALSRKWQVLLQGDVGGFGANSDFTWHAVAGVDYALSQRASVQLVYKRLSVERKSPRIGGGPPVALDLTVQGPLLGFAYRF